MPKRTLFVAPSHTVKPGFGGGQRTRLMMEALRQRGPVDAVLIGQNVTAEEEALAAELADRVIPVTHQHQAETGVWGLLAKWNRRKAERIATALRPRWNMYKADDLTRAALAEIDLGAYDLIVSRYLRPAAKLGLFEAARRPPLLIDIDDRDDQQYASRLSDPGLSALMRVMLRWHLRQIQQIFAQLSERCDHLWLASQTDLEAVSARSASVLPNVSAYEPEDGYSPTARDREDRILFVGLGDHPPNLKGALAFISDALPRIRAARPGATLRLVGKSWRPELHHGLSAEGVAIAGFVDDLAAEYEQAAVVIAPVFEGGGTKIKVIEAMTFAKPLVAHEHSLRGWSIGDGALVSAGDVPAMAEPVIALLSDPKARAAMGARAAESASELSGRGAFAERILSDCEAVLAR